MCQNVNILVSMHLSQAVTLYLNKDGLNRQ